MSRSNSQSEESINLQVPHSEQHTASETAIQMLGKIRSSDWNRILWKYRGVKGWKSFPQRCHQTVRYCGDYGHTWEGFTVTEEKILQQALLFPLWEKVRNGHYQLSIILAADKERDSSVPASHLPSWLWKTQAQQVWPAAPGSHLQVSSLLWLLEVKVAVSSSPVQGSQSKTHWGHKQGISSLPCQTKRTRLKSAQVNEL